MIEPDAATTVRPQPLGLFDGPAGLLLVPAGAGADALLATLATGTVPERADAWPGASRVVAFALADDVDAALAVLADLGDDRVAAIDRLVLAPTPDHLVAARAAAGDDPALRTVVASAAYASGLSDEPPAVDGIDGEFAVLALTVRAARALEFKDPRGALRALEDALPHARDVGPVLTARVLGSIAEHLHHHRGANDDVLALYDDAIRLLAGTDHRELQGGFHLERGLVAHQLADVQRHRLTEAVRSYQSALIVLDEVHHADRFALANMNVAVAILSMPMTQASDQVRLGVAVQSLRAALRVYRPDTHPWEWSSSQMNLANALQYLPSTHREENLQESVELYEEVLAHRSRRSDPVGVARVLANQANALAHLAVWDHAIEKYTEARDLFVQAGDLDAVAVVDRQLDQIDQTRGDRP